MAIKKQRIFERDEWRCCWCGKHLNPLNENDVTIDHIVPRCKGGNNAYTNLITSCYQCNHKRSSRTMFDFIAINKPMYKGWNSVRWITYHRFLPVQYTLHEIRHMFSAGYEPWGGWEKQFLYPQALALYSTEQKRTAS